MMLNMGPQHPSTHGVLRFIVCGDGEVMEQAIPVVGYLHRGIEKLAEMTPYGGFIPYTDRIDYLGSMFGNHAWCMAVEALAGIQVPRRAEYLRVIADELNRLASHLIAVGSMAMDIGAFTPFLHGIREREILNNLLESLCGSRLTFNYMRIGGVSRDLPPGFGANLDSFLSRFQPGFLDEFDRLIAKNEILVKRCVHVATVSAARAMSLGFVGPNLRASAVDWDLRRDRPYSVYPELTFTVPIGRGFRGAVGDSYDRFVIRIEEMKQSVALLRQAMANLPEGPIQAEVPRRVRPPAGEVYAGVESARGELGLYMISDGTEKPSRAKIRTGSFSACAAIESLSRGCMVADLVVLIGSLDLLAPEIDR
jgi:NADH-quinone oxidoreductase subunit D